MKHSQKGLNWVENLLEYSKCLNNDKHEELGCGSAFEVYCGRKSNELVKCGVPVNRERNLMCKKLSSHQKILYMNVKNVLTKREKRQKTLTKMSVIGQMSTTGREGSARNIRTEKKCLSAMERKTGKKHQKKDSPSLER